MLKPLKIGDLADATGTKVNTIRFYEEIGLMPLAVRTSSGRRTYGRPDLARLAFIRRGRALGFSIEEIRSLIRLSASPDQDCTEAAEIARCHLRDVEERLRSLRALRKELRKIADSCPGGTVGNCSVIEAIADP